MLKGESGGGGGREGPLFGGFEDCECFVVLLHGNRLIQYTIGSWIDTFKIIHKIPFAHTVPKKKW